MARDAATAAGVARDAAPSSLSARPASVDDALPGGGEARVGRATRVRFLALLLRLLLPLVVELLRCRISGRIVEFCAQAHISRLRGGQSKEERKYNTTIRLTALSIEVPVVVVVETVGW